MKKSVKNKLSSFSLEKEHILGMVLDHLLDAIITIDDKGVVVAMNKATISLFGYAEKEIIGSNISMLMSSDDARIHDDHLERYKKIGAPKENSVLGVGREVQGQRKDGSVFPMNLAVIELPLDELGRQLYVGSCHDLTVFKRQEEHIQRTYKMDSLGQLMSGIAHDYNNILGVVVGYAELLESRMGANHELAKYVSNIKRAGDRGANLTKKLLSLSKIAPMMAEGVDVNEIIQGMSDLLSATLTPRVSLVLELGQNLWPIYVDRSEFEDAMLNMSINSMHAIEGEGLLTIKTTNLVVNEKDAQILGIKKGDYCIVCIHDTGCGMDTKTQRKIFDPFFSTKGEKGTGLGLFQVYGFVSRNEGAIVVKTELGEGTQLTLYFPHYRTDETGKTDVSEDVYHEDLRGEKRVVLVVDDEEDFLQIMCAMLGDRCYKVLRARNGQEALDILEANHVDLIVSDIVMPMMNGYELLSRAEELCPKIKSLLISGYDTHSHFHISNDNSSTSRVVLKKPYSAQDLVQHIQTALVE